MNEQNAEQSPWDSLVGELGVEVNPDALERHQPPAQQLPTVIQERTEVVPPPAAPSDWAGLASSLGLEVPPEAPPRKPETVARKQPEPQRHEKPREERQRDEKQSAPRARAERHREERQRDDRPRGGRRGQEKGGRDRGRERRQEEPVEIQDEIEFEEVDEVIDECSLTEIDETEDTKEPEQPRISGEAARSAFDALFSAEAVNWGSAFVSPRTNVESSFLFTEGEEAVFAEDIPETGAAYDEEEEESGEEEPKKRPRRRRRGGRGRGRGRKPERAETSEEDTDDDSVVEGEELYESLSEKVEPTEGTEEEGEDRPERRRRRRRPRGRGRKSEEAESSPEEEDSNVRRRIAAHVDGVDEGEDEEEEDVDGDEEVRGGHRNLPTWNDAIGVIVESNLAQRSKAPAKQQNLPRGGRGRGGRRHKK